MFKSKQAILALFVLVSLLLTFFVVNALRMRQEIRPKAARVVGDIFLEPESGTYPPNSNFNIAFVANIGRNKFNVGRLCLSFDKNTVQVQSCTVSDDFESVAGLPTCTFDNASGTISLLIQAKNVGSGPTGSPILANINFKTTGALGGQMTVGITRHEVAVDTPTGETIDYSFSGVYGGVYQIGTTATATPIPPTVTPSPTTGGPTPTRTPTPSPTPSNEARLYLVAPADSIPKGSTFNVDIYLNTGTYSDISAVDVILFYDKSKIRAISVDGAGLFPSYVKTPAGSGIDESTLNLGKIQISGTVNPSAVTEGFIAGSNLKFADISFTAFDAVASTNINLAFDSRGAKNDCNVVSYNQSEDDILESVGNVAISISGVANTPTPTPNPSGVIANLAIRFQGVSTKKESKMVKITVVGADMNGEKTYENVLFSSDDNGVWSATLPLNEVLPGTGYIFLVKGPMHLQRKYCDSYPTADTETADYH